MNAEHTNLSGESSQFSSFPYCLCVLSYSRHSFDMITFLSFMFRVSVDSLIVFPQSFFFIIIWIVSLMLISQGILPMSRKRKKERENNFLLFLSDDHQFDWRDALSVPEKENSAKTFLLFGFFFLRLVCYGSHIGRRWTSCPEYEWKKREISLISFLFSLVATFFFSYIHFLIKIRLYCTIAMPKPFFFGGGESPGFASCFIQHTLQVYTVL